MKGIGLKFETIQTLDLWIISIEERAELGQWHRPDPQHNYGRKPPLN